MSDKLPLSSGFRWVKPRLDAAALLAEDALTDEDIAQKVGVTDRTLRTWKQNPEFAAKVQALVQELGDVARKNAIARRVRRVRELDRRWRKMLDVIEARAASPEMQNVPGGKTGLLLRKQKNIGSGDASEKVDEYEVDTALLKELREVEKQAAIELGQWTVRRKYSVEELDEIATELVQVAGDANPRG